MKKTGRPVSPHVTIYAFPIAALSSITVRVTGVALSFGAMGVGMLELFGGTGTSLSVFQDLGGAYGPLVAAGAKFSVAFPCVYHYLGAARHFAWDEKPELLTNIGVEKASYALYGASLFISGGLMIV
jgi:succinate dehydrogenase (ubiquinone) cytochrome b560 subunit